MRILHSVHSLDPKGGGVAEAIRLMAKSLENLGHQSTIITLEPLNSRIPDFGANSSTKVISLNNQHKKYGFSTKLNLWLTNNAKSFDAILIHGLWLYSSWGTYSSIKPFNIPYFILPHGMLDPWFKEAHPIKHLKKCIYWNLFENKVIRNAKAILYTTEQERLLAKQTFSRFKPKKEIVVGLGTEMPSIDKEKAKSTFLEKYPHLAQDKILLYLGRIDNKKGIDLLLKAFNKINPAEYSLVIAGPAEDKRYRIKLESLALTHFQAKTKIFFLPMLSGELKWGALAACDAFILPSHQENFAITIAEALAFEKPVLTTKKVNTFHAINKHKCGFVEDDTYDGIVSLLCKWTNMNQNQKDDLIKNTRACFLDSFEINHATKRLVGAIETCLV